MDFHVGRLGLDVHRHLYHDWSGPTCLEPLKGFVDSVGKLLWATDVTAPLGDGGEHTELVFHLVAEAQSTSMERFFASGGDVQDRGRGGIRFAHAAHRVRCSRACAGQAHSGPAGGSGIPVGHERRCLLVARADETDRILTVEQRVEDVHRVDRNDAKDGVNPVGQQGLNDGLTAP